MTGLFRRSSRAPLAPRPASEALTENRLSRLLLGALLLGIGPTLLYFYFQANFTSLYPDAMDYGQLGRNLSAGRGFSTNILRPLALTHGDNPLFQPDVTHGPLYPFILALAIGALGAKDAIVVGVSGLFYLLTIPLTYLLGVRVFNRTVGIIAALSFACNAAMLQIAISGLPMTMLIFLTTALLLILYSLAIRMAADTGAAPNTMTKTPRGLLILAGGLTGALYLTDPQLLFILPAVVGMVFVLCGRQRLSAVGIFALSLAAVVVPWMIRNGMLTGDPLFGLKGRELWMGTAAYPGYSAFRMMPDDMTPGPGLFFSILRKVMDNGMNVLPGLMSSFAGPLLVFFVPSLLLRFQRTSMNQLRHLVLLMALALFVPQLLFGVNLTLFAVLLPAFSLFAAGFVLHLGQQARPTRSTVVLASVAGVLVVACPILRGLMHPPVPRPLEHVTVALSLKARTRPNEVCLSDQPWWVAWYGDRPALWTPTQDARTESLRKRFGADWLFLTQDADAMSPDWGQVYRVFARWEVTYRAARIAGTDEPKPFQLSGKDIALLKALDGFGPQIPAVEPEERSVRPPAAILASAPSVKRAAVRSSAPPSEPVRRAAAR
jgi:hypothetical protein